MFYSFEGSLSRVRTQLEVLRRLPSTFGERLFVPRPEISAWSVGEHFDHMAKVCRATLVQVGKDEAIDQPPIRWIGHVILGAGWIPRGRGRSPERMRGAVGTATDLEQLIDAAREALEHVAAHPPRERRKPLVKHPVFGGLDARQSIRMLAVHNAHHMKIVHQIDRG